MTARRLTAVLLTLVSVLTAGCGGDGTPGSGGGALTVYSPSGLGDWYKSRFQEFTRQTGITVNLFEAGSGEVVSRVNSRAVWERLDKEPVPAADVLVTLPPFIQKAAKAGVLQPSGVDTTGIPAEAVGPGGVYVPIVNTALCFIVNPAAKPAPATWDDLLRPDLKGKLQYSTPGEAGDGTAMLLLLQQLMGKSGALDYLTRLQSNNVGPASSTGELETKVDSGELLVANGDVQMNLASIKRGSEFGIFFPAMPDGTRTTISLSYVAGVTTLTQRPEDAKKLLAFLLSDGVQRTVSPEAFGMPVREAIAKETIAEGSGPLTPTGVLKDVTLFTPDWNTVLAEIDGDIAAYKAAMGN